MRQVVPLAAAVRILKRVGAASAAPTPAAAVFFRNFRRVVFFGAFSVLSFFIVTTSSEKVMMDLFALSLKRRSIQLALSRLRVIIPIVKSPVTIFTGRQMVIPLPVYHCIPMLNISRGDNLRFCDEKGLTFVFRIIEHLSTMRFLPL